VEHGKEADLGTQVLGVSTYRTQGISRGSEENAVDHLLVLVGDRGNLLRNRKHNVEVLAIEKFGLAALNPLSAS
jgi:hypothetical protein